MSMLALLCKHQKKAILDMMTSRFEINYLRSETKCAAKYIIYFQFGGTAGRRYEISCIDTIYVERMIDQSDLSGSNCTSFINIVWITIVFVLNACTCADYTRILDFISPDSNRYPIFTVY
ncbi:unnamed protein product [Mytilus coruscus]|uniref:Uncharacterized protein n=1 Tax=Mytilus coruscus TaxID=42192 RepID=A0A6J8F0N0_MYTCO|nr:unnamed protein product [Mytilus coruscus]